MPFIFLALTSISYAVSPSINPPWASFLQEMQASTFTHKNLQNHVYSSRQKHPTAILFLPGMGEPAIKYHELIQEWEDSPVTFYFWDHIGQGFSSHLLTSETEKIHIDSFDTHIQSLQSFLKNLRLEHNHIFVIAHSMGGHIALRVLQDSPELIDKLATTAPMVDLNRYFIGLSLIKLLCSWTNPTSYALGSSFVGEMSKERSLMTHSLDRLLSYQQLRQEFPTLKRKWVTTQWVSTAIDSIENLQSANHQQIEQPILILQADQEYLVSNSSQKKFCSRQKNCQIQTIPKTYHEILVEDNTPRKMAIDQIKYFFGMPSKVSL